MYGEPIVIGGAAIYEMALPHVSTMYITRVKKEYDGDTFFPEINMDEWEEEILRVADDVTFVELVRRT